jgi:hypothetical protein
MKMISCLNDSVLFAYAVFVLSEDTSKETEENATTRLAAGDQHPVSGNTPPTPAALDHPSGRVEASDLALADSVLKAGKICAPIFHI